MPTRMMSPTSAPYRPNRTVTTAVLLRQEISRVFINLLSNAFFATGRRADGASEETAYLPTVRIATRNLKKEVEIRVWDNGIGMSDEVKNKIFTPFFTTKSGVEGTGLGLSLSYDIVVRQHHGSITVDSPRERVHRVRGPPSP